MSLRDELLAYVPRNEQEQQDKAEILHWLDSGMNIADRSCNAAHLTASGWVVSPDRKQVLLAYHNLYDSWAWMGGHADGETDLHAVARREVMEESGLTALKDIPGILSLEVLTVDGHIKKGKYVSSHLHLNITYLFEADPKAPIQKKPNENSAVAWFPVEEAISKSSEPWFRKWIYPKLIERSYYSVVSPEGEHNRK